MGWVRALQRHRRHCQPQARFSIPKDQVFAAMRWIERAGAPCKLQGLPGGGSSAAAAPRQGLWRSEREPPLCPASRRSVTAALCHPAVVAPSGRSLSYRNSIDADQGAGVCSYSVLDRLRLPHAARAVCLLVSHRACREAATRGHASQGQCWRF